MKMLRLSLCLLLAMFSILVHAQTAGSISGTARDPSDAVVQDARVTVINNATGATRSVTTNSSGYYTVPNLVSGTYTVRVEKAGFNAVNFGFGSIAIGLQLPVIDPRQQLPFFHPRAGVDQDLRYYSISLVQHVDLVLDHQHS